MSIFVLATSITYSKTAANPNYSPSSNSAFLNRSTLQSLVKTRLGLRLNLDGNLDLHAGAGGKLQHHLVHQVGKLLLGLDGIKFNAGVELAFGRRRHNGTRRVIDRPPRFGNAGRPAAGDRCDGW